MGISSRPPLPTELSEKAMLPQQNAFKRFLRMRKAALHESAVYLSSHPFSFIGSWILSVSRNVTYVPRLGYVVNSAGLSRKILRDTENFTKNGPGSTGAIWTQLVGERAITNMEGQEHQRLRSELSELFSESHIAAVHREVIEPAATRLREDLSKGDVVDLVPFARYIAAKAICFVLGITPDWQSEQSAYSAIFEHSERIASGIGVGSTSLAPDKLPRMRQEVDRVVEIARRSYKKGEVRRGSVIARLCRDGGAFEDIRGIVAVLMFLGTGTTSSAIPRIIALLTDSGEISRLRARPGLLTNAVDEGLRYVATAPIAVRSVCRDSNVDGYVFRAGRRVLIHTYNITRSRRHYANARDFDVTRQQPPETRHLLFGTGAHFCPGSGLARRQIQAIIQALLNVPGEVKIVKRRYQWRAFLPAYSKLELKAGFGK